MILPGDIDHRVLPGVGVAGVIPPVLCVIVISSSPDGLPALPRPQTRQRGMASGHSSHVSQVHRLTDQRLIEWAQCEVCGPRREDAGKNSNLSYVLRHGKRTFCGLAGQTRGAVLAN